MALLTNIKRVLLPRATRNKMGQLAISNAFLHGYLDHEIFIEQLAGHINSEHPDYADTSSFIKLHGSSKLFDLVYLDDILVTGTHLDMIHSFVKELHQGFPVRDTSSPHYFLGVEITYLLDGLLLSQQKYIRDLLSQTNMAVSKSCYTPMATSPPLSKSLRDPFKDAELYRKIVGALQCITLTRLDVAFSVNELCQFMHCPTIVHWKAVKCLLRYLKHTSVYGLFFVKNSSPLLQCFTDSD
ncbi:PREDICTED: uncharacterized mitochondrial protein AtMg00810-like [Theobroma cacao]|uniref:Uncharacterized mitochondrial protein AtMg00810-like n=1 Tax=Theobroma cacao TaxID=3641 RepID=A0AB32VRM6_THECC|nr:PREDICTED: uncharacterized mitochondrial protein AtMg00810-like [Theobroma cacao]